MVITGTQIRAARAALNLTIAELASAAGVAASTVRSIEGSDGAPDIRGGGINQTLEYRAAARTEALSKIVRAMEKAGIKFLAADDFGPGIRGRIK